MLPLLLFFYRKKDDFDDNHFDAVLLAKNIKSKRNKLLL